MNFPTLHFIVDPLCGWTYAAGPLMQQSTLVSGLSIRVHSGGMLTGQRRRQVTADWKDFARPHDQQITAMSRQPFGEGYYEGLLNDTSVVLDSTPPSIAIIIAQDIADGGIKMLNRLQHAYFYEGKKIFDLAVLCDLASELNFSPNYFKHVYTFYSQHVEAHFEHSRALLQKVGGQGFPTAVLQIDDHFRLLDISRFYGEPQQWIAFLNELLTQHYAPLKKGVNL